MRIENKSLGMRGLSAALLIATAGVRAEDSAWVSIIPKTAALEGWTVKFVGKAVGVNPDTLFRLSPEGYLWADHHTPYSSAPFGQLYYTKRKLSYYMARAEYHFTAENSMSGFDTWTKQNNGLMVHSPEPASVSGNWPNSIEIQLLGPKNYNEAGMRPSTDWPVGKTGNMCIAGDAFTVNYNGNNNYVAHCTPANYPEAWKGSKIPWEGDWAETTVRVLSDSLVQTTIRGQKVFELSKIRMKSGGAPVKDGYLAIQAEGTPTQFRKLDILDLEGCMDKSKPGYRTYFVKSNPSGCDVSGIGAVPNVLPANVSMVREAGGFTFRASGPGTLEVTDPSGRILSRTKVAAGVQHSIKLPHKGLCLIAWRSASASARILWTQL